MISKSLFSPAVAILLLIAVSCNDDNSSNNVHVYVVPSDAIAEYIAAGFSSATVGVNYDMENCARLAGSVAIIDSSFTLKKTDSSSIVKYIYDKHYSGSLVNSIPPKFQFTYTADGSFTTPEMLSQDHQSGNYNVSGLEIMDSVYSMTGHGNDGGVQESHTYKVDYNCTFSYTINTIYLDKNSNLIKSGSATIRASGSGPAGILFSYTGTITFTGNRHATLLLNNTTYYLNFQTGSVSK